MDGIFEELNVGLVSAEKEVDARTVEYPVAAKRFEQMTGNPEALPVQFDSSQATHPSGVPPIRCMVITLPYINLPYLSCRTTLRDE